MNICPVCKKDIPKRKTTCPRCGASLDGSDHGKQTPSAPRLPGQGAPGGAIVDMFFSMEKIEAMGTSQGAPAQKSTILIIWFALTAAIFVYGLAAYLISMGGGGVQKPPESVFLTVLSFIAVINWLMGFFLLKFGLHIERLNKAKHRAVLYVYIQTSAIISMALTEAVAVYGVVLVIMAHDFKYFLPFAIPAFVGMLLHLSVILNALRFADNFKGPEDTQ